jgi:hypothetical protein
MPNWCEGVLRIRGKQKDIINLVESRFVLPNYKENITESIKYVDDGKYMTITDQRFIETELWVKNSRRMFIELLWEFEFLDNHDMEEIITVTCNCRQAWGMDSQFLAELSNEYKVDFRIYAFEKGSEFNQDIEVINGEVTKDDTIKFKDYQWECIDPTIGG